MHVNTQCIILKLVSLSRFVTSFFSQVFRHKYQLYSIIYTLLLYTPRSSEIYFDDA